MIEGISEESSCRAIFSPQPEKIRWCTGRFCQRRFYSQFHFFFKAAWATLIATFSKRSGTPVPARLPATKSHGSAAAVECSRWDALVRQKYAKVAEQRHQERRIKSGFNFSDLSALQEDNKAHEWQNQMPIGYFYEKSGFCPSGSRLLS